MNAERALRRQQVIGLYKEVRHMGKVAERLGISRQRVQQICLREGYKKPKIVRPSAEQRRAERRARSIELFWSRVHRKGDGMCWEWTGVKTAPNSRHPEYVYGQTMFEGKKTYAHRLAYRLAKGDIPEGLTVDHICWNPLCCNPAHLQLLTRAENSARKNPYRPQKKRAPVLNNQSPTTQPKAESATQSTIRLPLSVGPNASAQPLEEISNG